MVALGHVEVDIIDKCSGYGPSSGFCYCKGLIVINFVLYIHYKNRHRGL